MYYLRYIGNGPDFMLLTEGIHTVLSTDIPISDSDYDLLFERQREGKSFKLKQNPEPNLGLWGCVEEEQNPVSYPEAPPSEMDILKEQLLQQQLATAEAIEKQETDKVEQQLAQAEMFETILQMLEPQGGGE